MLTSGSSFHPLVTVLRHSAAFVRQGRYPPDFANWASNCTIDVSLINWVVLPGNHQLAITGATLVYATAIAACVHLYCSLVIWEIVTFLTVDLDRALSDRGTLTGRP